MTLNEFKDPKSAIHFKILTLKHKIIIDKIKKMRTCKKIINVKPSKLGLVRL